MNIQDLADKNELFIAILQHDNIEFTEVVQVEYRDEHSEFKIMYKTEGSHPHLSGHDNYYITVPLVLSFMWDRMNCGWGSHDITPEVVEAPEYINTCKQLWRSDSKVEAIKLWRQHTNSGIMEARDAIKAL